MLQNKPIQELGIGESWLAPSCQVVVTRTKVSRWNVRCVVPGVQYNRNFNSLEETKIGLWKARIKPYNPIVTQDEAIRRRKVAEEKRRERIEKEHQEWLLRTPVDPKKIRE